MLRKRLIFTLLYDDGKFVLSRNFRLQRVGDFRWLQKNYNFEKISFFVDELIVLDVTRKTRDISKFAEILSAFSDLCFAPISAGGGVQSLEDARLLLKSGADKIVLNSSFHEKNGVAQAIANEFGQQCVVGSFDLKREGMEYKVFTNNGSLPVLSPLESILESHTEVIGEIYINSINQDGSGQGYDLQLLDLMPSQLKIPTILAGGAGNYNHFLTGLADERVDAVATAHLFNFVGDGLKQARLKLINDGVALASWGNVDQLISKSDSQNPPK